MFIKKKKYKWATNIGKLFNTTSHQGNTIQNHNEISLHSCQNDNCAKGRKQQMLARMWREGNSYTLLVQRRLAQQLWKTVWRFLLQARNRLTTWSSNPTIGYIPKRHENIVPQKYLHHHVYMSTVHNSQNNRLIKVAIII